MKNVVKLEYYFLPEHLIAAIENFVHFYNKQRYHESLNNLMPEDVDLGRADQILQQRRISKEQSLKNRYFLYQQQKIRTA